MHALGFPQSYCALESVELLMSQSSHGVLPGARPNLPSPLQVTVEVRVFHIIHQYRAVACTQQYPAPTAITQSHLQPSDTLYGCCTGPTELPNGFCGGDKEGRPQGENIPPYST